MTSRQSSKGKLKETSAKVEAAASRTQASLDETLTTLMHKLAPGKLIDGLLGLGSEGGELAAEVGRGIRRHPIPAAVTAVGLGWLLVSIVRSDDDDEDADDKFGRAADKARAKAGKAAAGAKAKAAEARAKAGEAGDSVTGFVKENPLACALAAVGVGVAVGALLPMTRKENEWAGETSDRVKRRVGKAASETKERAQAAASAAADTAREEAESAARREAEHMRTAGFEVLRATARAAGEALSGQPESSGGKRRSTTRRASSSGRKSGGSTRKASGSRSRKSGNSKKSGSS